MKRHCLICSHKLSKREKKLINHNPRALDICSSCVVAHNKVASKMKRPR